MSIVFLSCKRVKLHWNHLNLYTIITYPFSSKLVFHIFIIYELQGVILHLKFVSTNSIATLFNQLVTLPTLSLLQPYVQTNSSIISLLDEFHMTAKVSLYESIRNLKFKGLYIYYFSFTDLNIIMVSLLTGW